MYLGCVTKSLTRSCESTIASLPIPCLKRQRNIELNIKTSYYDVTHQEQATIFLYCMFHGTKSEVLSMIQQ